MRTRLTAALVVLAAGIGAGALWHVYDGRTADDPDAAEVESDWLSDLHSANPEIAEGAEQHLRTLGATAVPEIQAVLRDPDADPSTKKAAMKASGILGPTAAPVIPAIAEHLAEPGLTAEAAVALSYLGREAFVPLKQALTSEDPVVRREALRSLGKLRDRAPLESRVVIPLLLQGLGDTEAGVRTVAATYLGIIGQEPDRVLNPLIGALRDPVAEVRAAAATALGSFPESAKTTIPALRRATADPDPDVAREAGVSIVKLNRDGARD